MFDWLIKPIAQAFARALIFVVGPVLDAIFGYVLGPVVSAVMLILTWIAMLPAALFWQLTRIVAGMGLTLEAVYIYIRVTLMPSIFNDFNTTLRDDLLPIMMTLAILIAGMTYVISAWMINIQIVDPKKAVAWFIAALVFYGIGPGLFQQMEEARRNLGNIAFQMALNASPGQTTQQTVQDGYFTEVTELCIGTIALGTDDAAIALSNLLNGQYGSVEFLSIVEALGIDSAAANAQPMARPNCIGPAFISTFNVQIGDRVFVMGDDRVDSFEVAMFIMGVTEAEVAGDSDCELGLPCAIRNAWFDTSYDPLRYTDNAFGKFFADVMRLMLAILWIPMGAVLFAIAILERVTNILLMLCAAYIYFTFAFAVLLALFEPTEVFALHMVKQYFTLLKETLYLSLLQGLGMFITLLGATSSLPATAVLLSIFTGFLYINCLLIAYELLKNLIQDTPVIGRATKDIQKSYQKASPYMATVGKGMAMAGGAALAAPVLATGAAMAGSAALIGGGINAARGGTHTFAGGARGVLSLPSALKQGFKDKVASPISGGLSYARGALGQKMTNIGEGYDKLTTSDSALAAQKKKQERDPISAQEGNTLSQAMISAKRMKGGLTNANLMRALNESDEGQAFAKKMAGNYNLTRQVTELANEATEGNWSSSQIAGNVRQRVTKGDLYATRSLNRGAMGGDRSSVAMSSPGSSIPLAPPTSPSSGRSSMVPTSYSDGSFEGGPLVKPSASALQEGAMGLNKTNNLAELEKRDAKRLASNKAQYINDQINQGMPNRQAGKAEQQQKFEQSVGGKENADTLRDALQKRRKAMGYDD